MKKLFILSLIFFLLQNCGYRPIYSKNQNINFYIQSLDFEEGNNELASFIKKDLQIYYKKKNDLGYKIKAKINYSKNPLSKNSSGEIIEYELISDVEFVIKHKQINEKINIKEKFSINNFSDEFKEMQYERSVKQNMARSIVSKLLLRLTRLNDN